MLHGHRRTTIPVVGPGFGGLTAPTVVDGAMDGATSPAYIGRRSVPTPGAGDVAAMDDLPCHERAGVAEAIAAAGDRVLDLAR